ncbi:MAG: 3-phosphoshikimate 1-carboxyvinyltransferase [Elusimicrobiota bacterium]|jgi:3-phosphoshikimate 1-carboxyvinyltransferase
MESKTIAPAKTVAGTVEVPGDKSISHRAVILGALSNRVCAVDNFLLADDCLRTVEAFRQMGIVIESSGTHLSIRGQGLDGLKRPAGPIQCGNSGTTTRLLMGVLTGQPFDVQLIGDASLSRRPMDRVIEPLSQMGANFLDIKDKPAYLPLRMQGSRNVRSIHWKSPVASAQVKSAILLAGLYASGSTTVEEPSLSRDHTERMLQASGVTLERKGASVSVLGTATVRADAFQVPGDLSSAAFLLAAGLLRGPRVVVRGVGVNPTRTGFLDVIKAMGGSCRFVSATESGGEPLADIDVQKSSLKGLSIGGEMIPRAIDEIPILTVLATQAQGRTVISDAKELRVKESDRLAALREELSKMGAQITEKPDGLVIDGPTPLTGAVVKSHGDHRLAMSLAVAGLVAGGTTTIEDVACVATSFPSFWSLLEQLRGNA